MEQLLSLPSIAGYLQNGLISLVGLFILGGLGLYLFRNPLKAFISTIAGYRTFLDDYSFATHLNKESIYHNEVVRLTTGVNLKNAVFLFVAVLTALISPYLFAIAYLMYKYQVVYSKYEQLKDYQIYAGINEDDILIKSLNSKSARINLIVDEIWISSFILIGAGLYFSSLLIALIGVIASLSVLLTSIFIIYNIGMYRVNYKHIEYFRALRLLETSSLSGSKSLFLLGLLGFVSNFTDLAGFSPFIWLLFAVKLFITISTNSLLNREDNLSKQHQKIENRNYEDIEEVASYPNPISQSRGYKFTTALQMKFFQLEKEEKSKSLIHVDNYAFYPQMVNRSDLRKNPLLNETLKKSVQVKFESLDFTKQIVVLGGMGSGKTELINYMVQQVHESKFELMQSIIFNDIKGDFKQRFFRKEKDFLLNLFDSESSVWCIFTEMKYNIEAGTNFINNLFETIAGNEKDFFTGRAKQLTAQWLQEAYFNTDNNIEAWEQFFTKIKEYEAELEEKDDKTKSSILQTIQIAVEILSIMRYQIVVEKRKIFCISEFIYEKDTQLFLVNNKQFEQKLTPYLNGLWGAINSAMMSKEDTKEHLILNVLDEFLSMKIDETTRRSMMTATRSKGASNVIASQYLVNDDKVIQDLDSSRYALITFNINDEFTLKKVSEKLASAEMLNITSSPQQNNQQSQAPSQDYSAGFTVAGNMVQGMKGKQDNFSYSLGNSEVVLTQQLQSMPKYHHLTFIPSEETKTLSKADSQRFFRLMTFGYDELMKNIAKENDFLAKESGILYLGYTPQADLNYENEHFSQWDMENYYKDSLKQQQEKKDDSDIFDEETAFKHYMNVKFAGTVEEATEYITSNGLESYDIDSIFASVEEDSKKVLNLISKYSEQQRYELMDKFFDIPLDDIKTKYEFCKEHDLIGGILGIFTFSDEFRDNMLQED